MSDETSIQERRLQRHQEANELWERQGSRRCSTCKEPVVFAKHEVSGSMMIINARPDWTLGNIHLSGRGGTLTAVIWPSESATSNRAAGVAYHLDHHATCPYADQHRRKR